jgi:hypothetical protein
MELELQVNLSEDNRKANGSFEDWIENALGHNARHHIISRHCRPGLDGPVEYGPEVMLRRVDATLASHVGLR